MTVLVHDCHKPAGGWSESEVLERHGLVFVRSGAFRRRLGGRAAVVGPSMAYFEGAGTEMQISHPSDEGDATTVFFFTGDAVVRLAGDVELPDTPILTSGPTDLAHRRLVCDLRRGLDPLESEERVSGLVGTLMASAAPGRLTTCRSTTATAHRRIVDTAREAIISDPAGSDLRALASLLGHSPFHVSRVFHQQAGVTLTGFRNRIRAALAIERLEQGEADLAGLAVDLGFADQAHMTRVIRAEVGSPPGHVRRLLTPA